MRIQNSELNHFLLATGFWLLVSGFLNGCATVYNPATEKEELILIDTGSEVSLGRYIDFQVSQSYYIIKDNEINTRVKTIGEEIARVSDRQDLKYHFKVVKDKEINAFATPGGYIYIHTGLLDRVDDDELACIIGHEVGHIAARHIVKKLQARMGYDFLMSLAFGRGGPQDIERALNITFNLISLGYSREDELFADKLGLKYAYKAGYEPQSMLVFLKKLQELKKDKSIATPLFLRSHPYLEQRIKHAQEEIARLKEPAKETSSASEPSAALMPAPTSTPRASLARPDPRPKPSSSAVSYNRPNTRNQTQSSPGGWRRACPQCARTYPRGYHYCPKDGTKLD